MQKRILDFAVCLIAAAFCIVIPVLGASGESAGEPLVVGVPVDRCPIFYADDAGEPVGIGVDLMRTAAEAAGYTASFRAISEKTLKEALDNETYDVLMPFGSAIASAAGRHSIVSENLMQTPFAFVTTIRSREMPLLSDLRVGMIRSLGGAIETLGKLFPGMKIVPYETMHDSVKALRSGEVDALLHNSYNWSYLLQKPSYSDLMVQPSTVFSMDFRAGTLETQKGREVINRLNDGIATLTDTRRQAVILDYTSRKLYKDDIFDTFYKYGQILVIGVLLVAFVIIIAVQRVNALQRWHEDKIQQMMDHDPLTGLLNMNGFRKRVEELLHEYPDNPYFLSYNNIRDFKFINDSLGREAGDELLKFWAARSQEFLSESETIGRIDSDHFAVLRLIAGEDRMRSDEKNVFIPVQNYFVNQGKDHRIQMCSGIYVLTQKDFREIDVDHMLDLARVAEKRIRDSRKGDYEFYNPDQWQKGKRLAEIINFLPAAINTGDIQVWYQPQVNYEKRKIIGAEALCRWDHTKLGWLYPFDFISTLEEAGLIFNLDSFVWETVCKDLHRWNEAGIKRTVSVNISRDDIRENRDIPEHFRNLIQKYELTPDQLHIEITETAYVEKPQMLIDTTERLRSMGFQVEMDDFGSGYSSLHMLKEVPIDRIKLDLHFLTASGDPEKSRVIVSCMVQMVHMLGMDMIAEGVETIEQAEFLREKGCTEMQGYYFFKPMPVKDFENLSEDI